MVDFTNSTLRAFLQKNNGTKIETNTTSRKSGGKFVNFWDLKENTSLRVRFVNDTTHDVDNEGFWRDESYHELKFKGIRGTSQYDSTEIRVRVPAFNCKNSRGNISDKLNVPADCIYYNTEDPINVYCSQNNLYNSDRDLYDKLKKSTYHYFQGFVVDAPEGFEVDTSERLLKVFKFSNQIYDCIVARIMDSEYSDQDVVSIANGVDFKINVELENGRRSYKKSVFVRNETPLSEEQVKDITTNGYYDLREFLMKRPTEEQLACIRNMLEVFLAGGKYDPAWYQYYPTFSISKDEMEKIRANSSATKQVIMENKSTLDTIENQDAPAEPELEDDYIPYDKFNTSAGIVPEDPEIKTESAPTSSTTSVTGSTSEAKGSDDALSYLQALMGNN